MKTLWGFIVALLGASAFGQDRVVLLQEDFESSLYGWGGSAWGNGAQTFLAPGQCGSTTHSVAFTLPSTCNYSTGNPWFYGISSPLFTAFSTPLRVDFDYELSMDAGGDMALVELLQYDPQGIHPSVPAVLVADMSTLLNDGLPHHATISVQLPWGGAQWSIWFEFVADGIGDLLPGWKIDNVLLSEHSSISPFCFGDQTGSPCPCSNSHIVGGGCSNSYGWGGLLTAAGSVSVSSDDLTFTAMRMQWGQAAVLIEGSGPINPAGVPFRDGLLCLGPPIRRVSAGMTNGVGVVSFGPGLASASNWLAGSTHYVQVWYRDGASFCGGGSNLTQALAFTLAP